MASTSRKSLLLFFLAFTGCLLYAQPKLAIQSVWTLPADTVDWNGNQYYLEYRAIVTNVGNNVLNGPVRLLCRYNGDTVDWKKADFVVSTFEVGDTQMVAYTDTIDVINGARYKGGDNIIVIWPAADNINVQTPDSDSVDIFIKNLVPNAASDPVELKRRVQLYPNPVGQSLHLDYREAVHKLEYVRVVNLTGQVLKRKEEAVSSLDFSDLPAGLYMVELRYRDGVWGTFRVLHEN
jgi:hypothetical protein